MDDRGREMTVPPPESMFQPLGDPLYKTRLGVVIFGATGFTGKHAAAEMARLCRKHPGLSWGVAGRSHSKLESLMRDVARTTGEDQSHVKIIVADVEDEQSLKDMCSQARVIANCCGPFRLYGEPVVKAAIECKTHHVDITGEPQFIESMQLKYNEQAREAGVYVISACAYDSIPNDMGVVFLQRHFGGTVNSVESYMSTYVPAEFRAEVRKQGTVNHGTWESLVYSLAHYGELKHLRKKLFPERLPTFTPKLKPRSLVHSRSGRWCVPFPGVDPSVVYRSQRHFYEQGKERPVQFRAYSKVGTWWQAVTMIVGAAFLFLMSKVKCLRNLLLDHPLTFSMGRASRQGPTKAVTENNHYAVELHGTGWSEGTDLSAPPNKRVVAKVSGKDPAYGCTVVALLYSAVTVLEEGARMPGKGGVLTTAVAFRNTSLIEKLNDNGIKFEIVETSTI